MQLMQSISESMKRVADCQETIAQNQRSLASSLEAIAKSVETISEHSVVIRDCQKGILESMGRLSGFQAGIYRTMERMNVSMERSHPEHKDAEEQQ